VRRAGDSTKVVVCLVDVDEITGILGEELLHKFGEGHILITIEDVPECGARFYGVKGIVTKTARSALELVFAPPSPKWLGAPWTMDDLSPNKVHMDIVRFHLVDV